MWHTLPLPWKICLEEAWTAYGAGTVPVGAVIVDDQGRIQAHGRNQIVDNGQGSGLVRNTQLAHAELNALLACDYRRFNAEWTLYTILEPCPLCLGAFYMSGLRRLAFAARDPYAGSVNLLGATPYLARKPIKVQFPASDWLEQLTVALNIEVSLRKFADRPLLLTNFLAAWREVIPQGVALGERLYDTGELQALAGQGAGVEAVVERLYALLTAVP